MIPTGDALSQEVKMACNAFSQDLNFFNRIALNEIDCWFLRNGWEGRLKASLGNCLVMVEGRSGGMTWVQKLTSLALENTPLCLISRRVASSWRLCIGLPSA